MHELPYPHPFDTALRRGELALWQQSHAENKACKAAIERVIESSGCGTLAENGIRPVLDAFGFHRTAYVLANAVRHCETPQALPRDIEKWAAQIPILPDKDLYVDRNELFALTCDASTLTQCVRQYRDALRARGLFDERQCLPHTEMRDFEGEVVAVLPRQLEETKLQPQAQLWLCTGGSGAYAGTMGRAVFAVNLCNGEETRWNREDILGVLADNYVPEWAREQKQHIQMSHDTAQETTFQMSL